MAETLSRQDFKRLYEKADDNTRMWLLSKLSSFFALEDVIQISPSLTQKMRELFKYPHQKDLMIQIFGSKGHVTQIMDKDSWYEVYETGSVFQYLGGDKVMGLRRPFEDFKNWDLANDATVCIKLLRTQEVAQLFNKYKTNRAQ